MCASFQFFFYVNFCVWKTLISGYFPATATWATKLTLTPLSDGLSTRLNHFCEAHTLWNYTQYQKKLKMIEKCSVWASYCDVSISYNYNFEYRQKIYPQTSSIWQKTKTEPIFFSFFFQKLHHFFQYFFPMQVFFGPENSLHCVCL